MILFADVNLCHAHHMESLDALRRRGAGLLQASREDVLEALRAPGLPEPIEQLYEPLTPEQRMLLNRLTVFAGSWTAAAAAAVCGGDGLDAAAVPELLQALLAGGLAMPDQRAGEGRYRLPDEVRLHVGQRLSLADPIGEVHRRQAHWSLEQVEALEPALWGPDLVACLDRLELNHENIRASIRWCIGAQEAEVALRLCAAVWRFWEVRGHEAEGLGLLEDALALPAEAAMDVRARALDAAGNLARSLGAYDRATAFYVRGLQARLKLGDTRGVALTLNNLAVSAQFGGNPTASLAHQEASIDLFRELGDPSGVALSLITLGTMAQLQGRAEPARRLYEESLALFRTLDDKRGAAACLNNLGNAAGDAGQLAEAQAFYTEALDLFRDLGDPAEEAACLRNLALVELAAGEVDRAAELCQQSLDMFDNLADGRGMVATLGVLARVACGQGRYEVAARVSGAAAGLQEVLGLPSTTPAAEHHPLAAEIESALGQSRAGELRTQGRMMPLAQAIAAALPTEAPL